MQHWRRTAEFTHAASEQNSKRTPCGSPSSPLCTACGSVEAYQWGHQSWELHGMLEVGWATAH
eukprot:5519489-Prorocentrum_lima.AAC.1